MLVLSRNFLHVLGGGRGNYRGSSGFSSDRAQGSGWNQGGRGGGYHNNRSIDRKQDQDHRGDHYRGRGHRGTRGGSDNF